MNYSELTMTPELHKAVERMGFTELTEVQEKAIPVMLAGRDIIAKAPTGTGKTCAFGIPLIMGLNQELKAPQAVVMAPTRELAQQIAEDLKSLAHFYPEVRIVTVYGGANMQTQIDQLRKGAQVVVATPGRLQDHMNHHTVNLSKVTTIVLDEADEMLNMGFYKDVRKILDSKPSVLALNIQRGDTSLYLLMQ
ncbi:MAG: DEAD/DEAH box helicase [Ruthenibacterium sp.]